MHMGDFVLPEFIEHWPDFGPQAVLIPGDNIEPLQEGTLPVPPGYQGWWHSLHSQFGPLPEDVFGFSDPKIEESNFIHSVFPVFTANAKNGEEVDSMMKTVIIIHLR